LGKMDLPDKSTAAGLFSPVLAGECRARPIYRRNLPSSSSRKRGV